MTEKEEIAALKARIERLENAKELMAKALYKAHRYLSRWEHIRNDIVTWSPSECVEITDAALEMHSASSNFEMALHTLSHASHFPKPTDAV